MIRGRHLVRTCALLVPAVVAGSLVTASGAGAAEDTSVLGQDGGSLILVLDGSGSMKESAGGGKTRMEAAKEGLLEVIDQLPEDSRAGLRVYGSEIDDGPGSCEDSELLAPVDDIDKDALKSGVEKLKPLGNTPIAYSLEKAYADLPKEGPRSIVLVSDGEENCGGDPCKVARDLRKKGADFYVDVVGLQVDAASRNQLTCIASAGGGTYYDVKDLKDLTKTLTRTSVRAARGYEPAGLPVEGGTDAASAAPIEDGQWLDTVGDSGTEYYEVPDPEDGTVHASAAQPRTGSFYQSETLSLQLQSASGTVCGRPEKGGTGGNDDGRAPVSVAISVSAEDREACGEGPYVLAVDSEEVRDVAALEIALRTEPAVENLDSLPAAQQGGDAQADVPEGEPAPVIGGPNFSSAPPTAPGRYADSILAGEVLFYRVPDVGWGQQVVCDLEVQPSDEAADVFGFGGATTPIALNVYGPMKTDALISDSASTARYNGKDAATAHTVSPPVTYRNRESTGREAAASLDGDYYCQVNSLEGPDSTAAKAGEFPFVLTVDVVGEVSGEPEYASDPAQTANDQEADDSDGGVAWPLLLGALAVLLGLMAAFWALVRRRRAGADEPAEATPPPPGD